MPKEINYGSGVRLAQALNSIKHTPHSFAASYNLEVYDIINAIENDSPPSTSLREAIISHSALSFESIFSGKEDETKKDIEPIILSREESQSTARIFKRLDEDFYIYKDLACSYQSVILPEHITPLVNLAESNNGRQPMPEQFNKGHLEHQLTFFIGEIDFHWKENDRVHSKQMDNLSCNYIHPYVPHTFTTRKRGSYIVAVTYKSMCAYSRGLIEEESNRFVQSFTSSAQEQNSDHEAKPVTFFDPKDILDHRKKLIASLNPTISIKSKDFSSDHSGFSHTWLYVARGKVEIDAMQSPNTKEILQTGDSALFSGAKHIHFLEPETLVTEVQVEVPVHNLEDLRRQLTNMHYHHGATAIKRLVNDNQKWF